MPVCQFTIPHAAAGAIDLTTLQERARAAGHQTPRFEATAVYGGSGAVRITCSAEMAKFLVNVLTECASAATRREVRQACLDSVAAAVAELQQKEYGMTQGITPNRMG